MLEAAVFPAITKEPKEFTEDCISTLETEKIAPCIPLCGMMDTMVGAIRGLGYSVMPMIVSLIGACGLRVLWVMTIFQCNA